MSRWPELPYEDWRETRDTLHMFMQIVGKVRLALEPMEPQWAQVPLYLTARGLNTSPIPHPGGPFDIDVDFIDHVVTVRTARGPARTGRLAAPARRRFLRGADGRARRGGRADGDHRASVRGAAPDPVPGRHRARELRARGGDPLLARTRLGRPRAESASGAVPRQGLPRAVLLGLVRPRVHAVLGPAARAAGGCRRDHALLARCRADLRRLLARQRDGARGGVLRVHLPEPGGNREHRRLAPRTSASSSSRTTRCVPPAIRERRCSTFSRPPTGPAPAAHGGRRSSRREQGRVRRLGVGRRLPRGTGRDARQPLGAGGQALHEWAFATQRFRELHGLEGGVAGADIRRDRRACAHRWRDRDGPAHVQRRRRPMEDDPIARRLVGRGAAVPPPGVRTHASRA